MRVFSVSSEDAGKRIDRYIENKIPDLSFPLLSKTFRKRDVKINGSRVKESHVLSAGDQVELYLPEDMLNRPDIQIPVIFEDDNILVVDKPRGIPVQDEKGPCVETALRPAEATFPALCHRLDRNTGGLLLLAKNKKAHTLLVNKFKQRQITKLYYCVICGNPDKASAELKAFLLKESQNRLVRIFPRKIPGSVPIQTNYRVLETTGELSLVEVELVTGRTHQIRAHMAYIGHPVLGDGKYGKNKLNRQYGFKRQLLWSSCIQFAFTSDADILNYLAWKTISLPQRTLKEILNERNSMGACNASASKRER